MSIGRPMRFDLITIFPELFDLLRQAGVVARAHAAGGWNWHTHNPRDFTEDNYRRVDDRPYGGGPGMVMLAQPLMDAIEHARAQQRQALATVGPVLLLSAGGAPLRHRDVLRYARLPALTLVCGRYEGVDHRLIDAAVDEEVNIGEFVVSGGELPAMMLIDAIVRWLPGTLGDAQSAPLDSFATGLLDWPQYTRPERWAGADGERDVPPVLLSGDHRRIARWRRDQALRATARRRPELIEQARAAGLLDQADEAVLAMEKPD